MMDGLGELQQLTKEANATIKELESQGLVEKAISSAEEYRFATSGGAGSPIEVRMAAAFNDTAAALKGIAQTQERINAQQSALVAALEHYNAKLAAIDATIWSAATKAADAYVSGYASHLDEVKHKADETVEALGKVDLKRASDEMIETLEEQIQKSAQTYQAAVSKSTKKLLTSSATSAGVIAVLSLVGGLLAFIGAFFTFQVLPEFQSFVERVGWSTVWVILVLAAVIIWFVWCYRQGQKK